MKTLHTIYTNFAKRVLMALALITMGVGTAWGTSYISYNNNEQDETTTISSANVSNGSAGAISWTGTNCSYSSNRVNITANGSITFTVSGGNVITKIVVTSGSSEDYYGTWTSTSGSVSSTSGVTTISGINSNSVTIKTSTAFRCTSASTIKIYYTQDTGGGIVNCNGTYDFTKIDGLNTWGTSYSKHTVEYLDATVTFSAASKQTGTITDQPVTKGSDVSLVMIDNSTLSAVTWVCEQWTTKTQTITLHYSTDGGDSYTSTGITSSNFTISSDNLPVRTNAVKITFSNSSNQVGITSCSIEKVCGPIEVTVTLNPDGGTGTFTDWTTSGDNYTMTVDAGTEITLPELSKTGYDFDGWHDGTKTVTSPYTPTTDITLTAQWTAQQYDITYKDQGNKDFSGNHTTGYPTKHTYGTATTLKDATKTGYTFGGWYKESACTNKVTTLGAKDYTSNITLYAQWTANTYTVQFDANGGTGSMNDQSFTYGIAQNLTANAFEKFGHTFAGWSKTYNGSVEYIDGQSVSNLTSTNNGTVTLYAKWTEKSLTNYRTTCTEPSTFTVTYNANDATSGSVPEDNTEYAKDAQVIVLGNTGNLAKTGYTFSGWNTEADGSGTDYAAGATFTITENTTLYAQWTAKTATSLSWSADTYSATIDADNTFPTLTKTPADLTGITYSSSDKTVATIDTNTGDITLVAAGTTTITATFTETDSHTGATASYTLTVNPSNCRWVEVEIGDIEPEDEVVVTMKTTNGTYTLDHSKESSENPPAIAITVNGNEAKYNSTKHQSSVWNISGNATDGYVLYPNGSTSKWLYCTSTAYNVKVGTYGKVDNNYFFTIEDNYLKNKKWNVYIGVYNFTDWRHYPANTGNAIAGQTLKFYKRECLDSEHYWVTWDAGEGLWTDGSSKKLESYAVGDDINQPAAPSREGYRFDGWTPAPTTMLAENTTFTAVWTEVFTITWDAAGATTTQEVETGQTIGNLPVAPTSCSDTYTTFVGWYTAASGMETSPSTEPQGEQVTTSTVPTDNATYYAVWADGSGAGEEQKSATLDFSTNSWDFPIEYTTTEQTYTNGTYSIILKGTGDNGYKYNSNQILLGKSDAYMKLPAFPFKVSKIVASKPDGAVSGKVTWNVYSGDNEVSTAVTGCTNGGTFEIADNNQTAGTVYTIKVTNANNLQIKSLDIYSLVSAATGYISSCCQSQTVVTVTPENDNLELDIEGTASTTVYISEAGSTNGGSFSADVTGSATLGATNEVTDNPYKLTFTATEKGEYTINGIFTDNEFDCPKYGSATINVAANPILQASAEALEFSPTCGQNSASQEVEINSRYLTSNSITATVATTNGIGKFTISTDNITFGTSDLTLSGGKTTKVADQIYVRYEAEEGETGAVAGTLTLKCGTTQKVINLTGTCTCSANVTITGEPIQITAANGIWVEAATELTVTGTFLTTNANNANVSIRAYTNNAAFQIKKGGVTGEGAPKTASNNALTLNTDGAISTADWTGSIGIVYKPTQANTTETATLTVEVYRHNASTIYSTATYELEGRSLPEQFVIAVTNGSGDWFAVPADMVAPWGNACSGLGTFAPYPISVDNTTAPTIASEVPARAVYQAAARTGNVNTNPQTMSYKSVPLGGNYYLYGSSTSVESDGSNTNIQNASFAASEKQKWFMDVVDWNTKQYNMHVHSSLTTNVLAYTTAGGANCVGQYSATAGTTKKAVYLLPINGTTCTYYAAPVVTVMAIDATNATIQFKNDRTTAYEISLDQNTWTDLPVTLIKDCNNSEEATLLQAQLPLATYRGKTVYIRAKVTSGNACQETGSFVVPNPTIDRGETPWKYTGMAGQAFSDNSRSITISNLWNPLSVSVVQQVTGSNIQASITPEGVVTVSMAAEDATEGDHKAVLEFTSAGAETKQVGVVITLHSLALQEFDGGDYNTFWEGILCKDLIDFSGGTPTIYLSYQLYLNGTPISTTAQLNQTAFSLVDLVTGESLTISRDGNTGSGVAFVTIPTASVAKMVPGHTYRLSWENTNQVMTDKNGLPYMDCYMDFVYSENCDAPTALAACPITNSGFTANWVGDADKLNVYTKAETIALNQDVCSATLNIWKKYTNDYSAKWLYGLKGDMVYNLHTTYGFQVSSTGSSWAYLYTPQIGKILAGVTANTEIEVTIEAYCTNTANKVKCFVIDGEPTNTTFPQSGNTVSINGSSASSWTSEQLSTPAYTEVSFRVSGLTSTSRIAITALNASKTTYIKTVKISSVASQSVGTYIVTGDSYNVTGLSANTTYYYTVGDGNGNNTNEIAVTTYSGAPSLKYYSDETCTTEITETKVLGGEETTIFVKGTNISACELVPSVTTGYAYDDSGLSYKPSTGDVSGKIILTLTDPANTVSGTLTIAGYPLDLISSDCPAGFNNMANDATNVTSNSAQANWNRGLNFGDDPSGKLLLYENGEVFVELVENGDFETGSLTDGWSSSIHTGPSDGNKAFNDYELVNDNDEYSLYVKDDANCGTLANFHNMTLMYANYVTLKPGTYRMKAQVKVPEVSGYADKKIIFAIGLVQSGLSVIAVSPEKTVLSNNTYVEIIYEFELANEMTVCPAIGARQEARDFRKFYIDNVSLMRIKCPGPGDLIREIPITDLGTGFEEIEGLKPNTEYTYVIKNVNDCESNEITFYTGQGNYMPMQVVEWKENSVVVMYTGSETNAIVMIGSNTPKTVALTPQDVAIYEIPITGLIEHPTEKLYITIGEGFKALTIPYIISATKDEDDLTTNRDLARTSDIVILNEGKLNIKKTDNAAYQFHDITIYGGGKMIVEGEVKIASLTMRIGAVVNGAHQALYPQLVLKGQITNSSRQINLDYLTTYDRYYALSVPYSVLTESIHYPADIYGDNLTTGNKASFALQWYDGAARASETRKGWKDLEEPATLDPYQGYTFWGAPRKVNGVRPTFGIHRIPMPVEDVTIKDNETTDKTINVYAHPAANAYDAGWNFIGNPYLAQYGKMADGHTSGLLGALTQNPETGVWEHTGNYRYITLTDDGKTYWQTPVSEAELYPFNTFFVQAGDENGAVSFNASNRASLPARRYAAQQESAKEITTGIILTGNDQTDRTGLLIADNFTEEYDFNADLSKFENSGINLYTIGKDGKLAYMAINQALAEQPIPVGYSAPAEGLYTIAFDEGRYNATDISALYLIDYDSNEKTNLLHTDYSFVTATGTNNQRFALQVAFVPANSTNVEWVGDATIQVGVEGHELILNNLPTDAAVHVFDALGRLMYHTPHAPTEIQLTLPTGYYLVRIADKQNAVVTNIVIP